MHLIVTHENADFDAAASLLGAVRLNPRAVALLPERINRNVSAFLTLYKSAFPFVSRADLFNGKHPPRITRVTVVDTRRASTVKGIKSNTPTTIIDHHPNDGVFLPNETFEGEIIGANTTLLIERIMKKKMVLPSLEATLLMLGIYEDTGCLSYRGTTSRDIRAAAWLLDQGAVLDTVRKYLEPPLTDEQQSVLESLVKRAETRSIQGYPVTVAAIALSTYLAELSAVAHRLRDTLDPVALIVLVEMPQHDRTITHLIARSTDDAIDAGEIARMFGGGGHPRAASAPIPNPASLEMLIAKVWELISLRVRPAVRVANLMSYGVQTVEATLPLATIAPKLRRIGHEGFPVVQNGAVVGLLTRRQVDRAIDHEMGTLTVGEVMTAGTITLTPDAPAALLEKKMVESGWGQIPVVDDSGRLIGIVTRTDLLKHWAEVHPGAGGTPIDTGSTQTLSQAEITRVLGTPAALIERIAAHAASKGETVYMVGGVVRDILLERRNLDLDFVVESPHEGAAIHMAETLQARFGGRVTSFKPFGTAKWRIDQSVADALNLPLETLPDHVDFAAARSEFYEYPTALPTTYAGGIKLDLARRDFSINTLAVQLSASSSIPPARPVKTESYPLIDEFGGLRDLREGVIRVLHSLSFIDDPTRILRAARFEHRFSFTIEPRTLELMRGAYPMLRRITGERVRNELTLILRERSPEKALKLMAERGILSAIYPAFVFGDRAARAVESALVGELPPHDPALDRVDLAWHTIAAFIPLAELPEWTERLMFGKTMTDSLTDAAQLVQTPGALFDEHAPASQITAYLENKILDVKGDMALIAAQLCLDDSAARDHLENFRTQWRATRPTTTGETLKTLGLKPGRCYGIILNRLRAARLDKEITTDSAEHALLDDLIGKGICRDDT